LDALLSPMGIATRDLDGDGRLDLCMTDTGPTAPPTSLSISPSVGRCW
jgi:hypothetical protein